MEWNENRSGVFDEERDLRGIEEEDAMGVEERFEADDDADRPVVVFNESS